MKILNIVQRYYPAVGGSEKYIQIMSEHLAHKGNDVEVWTSDAIDIDALWDIDRKKSETFFEVHNSVTIRRFKIASGLLSNKWINKLYRVILHLIPINKVKYLTTVPTVLDMYKYATKADLTTFDIVHVTAAPFSILFYIASIVAKRTGAKLVITPFVHLGIDSKDKIRDLYFKKEDIYFYKMADLIFVQTNSEKDAIIEFCFSNGVNLNESKFSNLGMGVFPEISTYGNSNHFKSKYNIKNPIVFYIGAKVVNKGIINLVEAMKLLWEKGEECTLVLAGNETKEFIKYWNLQTDSTKRNTISLINVSEQEKWDIYATGDIFSMVSRSDSFGIVYLEAWLYKKPVIGCKTEAMSEIISQNIDGLLVPFDNIQEIANSIKRLLDNKELRNQMGENGYIKVIEHYSWDTKLKQIDAEFSKLIEEKVE
jgi:glycosyltransferase involved in cell wall biosynthesis